MTFIPEEKKKQMINIDETVTYLKLTEIEKARVVGYIEGLMAKNDSSENNNYEDQ